MNDEIKQWQSALNDQFPEWDIHTDSGRVMIRVPDTADFEALKANFSDLVVIVQPFLTPDEPRLAFIVSNSVEDFQYVLSHNEEGNHEASL